MGGVVRMDKRPTMSEWPVRVCKMEEIPPQFAQQAKSRLGGSFHAYDFVYAPKRRTDARSYEYFFGYGEGKVFFMREGLMEPLELLRDQIKEVATEKELLNAKIIVQYQAGDDLRQVEFPYVPSVYYLYDPFLNWLLGLDKRFQPMLAEKEHPRPEKLYKESLAMFNYAMGAYRLGTGFLDYSYRSRLRRCKWMPWKKDLEEWLEVPMERGQFHVHCFKYLTDCIYSIQ